MLLYAVTDSRWLGTRRLCDCVEQAIKGGVTFVQLREKHLSFDEFVELAKQVKSVTDLYNIPFVINDNVQVAIACNADGVHVGQEDISAQNIRQLLGEDKIIGVSAHNVSEAKMAQQAGANYIGVGAVFSTGTKDDVKPLSQELLKDICSSVTIPTVAIGGINRDNILSLSTSGADGVAVVSAIFAQQDIEKAAAEMKKLSLQMSGGNMKKVLTIAGSDCSGGAGIQADLKTMTAHKVYGMSVITALTAQNTTGVYGISEVEPSFVAQQMNCVFNDIFPDAVKIGMVASADIIRTIAAKLAEYKVKNVVVDPVMVATSGARLINDDAVQALTGQLFPIACLVTPNLREAEALCGFPIKNREDMVSAAEKIALLGCKNVLVKGGHLEDNADDLLYMSGDIHWYSAERVDNPNTHGTGCTLSSAIASNLALDYPMQESIARAKGYINAALNAQLNLGKGSGPLDHCCLL